MTCLLSVYNSGTLYLNVGVLCFVQESSLVLAPVPTSSKQSDAASSDEEKKVTVLFVMAIFFQLILFSVT
jgi:hypothetical protein